MEQGGVLRKEVAAKYGQFRDATQPVLFVTAIAGKANIPPGATSASAVAGELSVRADGRRGNAALLGARSIAPQPEAIHPPSKAALTFLRATAGSLSLFITVCRSSIAVRLPVPARESCSTFVNLKSAAALGLTLPQTVLGGAEE